MLMSSNIEYKNIDNNFPVAGADNDSQGFRDNFNFIKNGLRTASDEITELQANSLKSNSDLNLNGFTISNFSSKNKTEVVNTLYQNGIDFTTINECNNFDIDYSTGSVFLIKVDTDDPLPLEFVNWPNNNYASIRLFLYSDDVVRSVTWVNSLGIIKSDSNFPEPFILSSSENPKIVDVFTFDAGTTIYLKYISDTDDAVDDNLIYLQNNTIGISQPEIDLIIQAGEDGNIILNNTTSLLLPKGTSNQRPQVDAGAIRYNTEIEIFEGFFGSGWSSLGGVNDADNDTFIRAEQSVGSDNDFLEFFAQNNLVATIDKDKLTVNGNILVSGNIISVNNYESTITSAISAQADTIALDSSVIKNFITGQNLRLFNASLDIDIPELTTSINSVDPVNLGTSGDTTRFSYKMCEFDFLTGKITPAESTPTSVDITTSDLENFNNLNNIIVTFNRSQETRGILLYRDIGETGIYKLISVLGPKDLGTSTQNLTYIDYYTYDQNNWAEKNSKNEFTATSKIIHIPVEAPVSGKLGWTDVSITNVDQLNNTITIDKNLAFGNTVTVVHDDTELVQNQIDQQVENGVNYYELGNRDYYIKYLKIPRNFNLYGNGSTRLIKQYWSTDFNNNSNILISPDIENEIFGGTKFSNFEIDGNFLNQYLVNDNNIQNFNKNYICYGYGKRINFDNVTIRNSVGGGIFLKNINNNDIITADVYISNCLIENGAVSYRYDEYSPVYAPELSSSKITTNTFRNFPNSLDITASNSVLFTPNIVKNCGEGVLSYGSINSIFDPNILLGPANEFLPLLNTLNSEYNSVNIQLEQNIDFNSYVGVYQENGDTVDLSDKVITGYITELRKVNGVEELATDYSTFPENGGVTAGDRYIQLDESVNASLGEFKFRITSEAIEDLLSRASYEILYNNNTNTQGLVYRLIATEYVPKANIISGSSHSEDYNYVIQVNDTTPFQINTIVSLSDHSITPAVTGLDAIVVEKDPIFNSVTIKFLTDDNTYADIDGGTGGVINIKNNFVLVKGKIN